MGRRRRPAVAAVLALAVAGLGHAYLRRWGRAAAWFLTIVTTGVVLVDAFADPNAGIAEMPLIVLVPLLGLFVLSAVDAYLLASRTPASGGESEADAGDDGPRCPECGREVDPELDFCQWCTRRLSFDPEADADADAGEDGPRGRSADDGGRAP